MNITNYDLNKTVLVQYSRVTQGEVKSSPVQSSKKGSKAWNNIMNDEEQTEQEKHEEEEEEVTLDSTITSAAFIIGTTISGGDPDVGVKFAQFIKKIRK